MAKVRKEKLFKTLFHTFGKLYDLLRPYRKFFYLGIVLIFSVEALNLVFRYIFKDVIDFFFLQTQDINILFRYIIYMAVISFAINVIQFVNEYLMVKTEVKFSHHLSLVVYKKLLDLSLAYHEKENTGSKLSKINHGLDSVSRLYQHMFWGVIPTTIQVVSSFGLLLYVNWQLSLIFILVVPLFIYLTLHLNTKVNPLRKTIRKGFEDVYGGFGQTIYNIKTVKAFVQEDREKKRSKRGVMGILRNQIKFFKILFSVNFMRNNLIALGSILVVGFGAYLTYQKQITPGELSLFLSVSASCYYSLFSLTRIFDQAMEAKVGIERMYKILESEQHVEESDEAIKLDLKGAVEFNNVTFDYGEGKVLKNVSFNIKPGEVVALVGPSGGGKSTVVKLLYRYYDCQTGSVLLDGTEIEKLNLQHFREQLGIVTQDIDVFNDTIRDNIAYGRPRAKLSDVKAAAKIANADEFIRKFSKKYDSIVGERGIKLSGGQKQRVGIARAVLMDPKVLVLDEATSSLDASSEKMIQEAIQKVIQGRTTIIIAHRLSTVQHADRIIVIDKGRVSEQGTHKQLIRKNGLYKKLVKLQIGGYLNQ
jgi:ABC-type multidrug transport system fused ATPase/permease subunit